MTPYVPILGVELGTLDGLAATSEETRAALTPLFDARGPAPDRIGTIVDALARTWGPRRRAMLDFGDARRDERVADGRLLAALMFDEARARELEVIPVTGLRRSAAYQLAIADAANTDQCGAAVRLALADFADLGALQDRIAALPDLLSLESGAIDVVVDFGQVVEGQLALLTAMARAVLAAVTRAAAWRSIAVAASALPTGAAPLVGGAVRFAPAITRTEWQLWRALASTVGPTQAVRFADYGAQWPTPSAESISARLASSQRQLFYTSETEWLVVDPASATLGDLVTRPVFRGANHCAGDAFLAEHSHPGDAPASDGETAWRAAATVHHLTVVVEQLTAADASGTSGASGASGAAA